MSQSTIRECWGEDIPPVEHTVLVAEAIHRALVRKAAGGTRIDCPELTGHGITGRPLTGPHSHMHILPIDADGDGFLDHVVFHAPMGISQLTLEAIAKLSTLFGRHGRPWLHLKRARCEALLRYLNLTDQGYPASPDFLQNLPSQQLTDTLKGYCQSTSNQSWESITPFVPPRYLKKTGKNSLIGQVESELASRRLPKARIEVLESPTYSSLRFVLRRQAPHSQPPQNAGFSLKITFESFVSGPLCLGYASHFGLGLFRIEDF